MIAPPKRMTKKLKIRWIPAFAGMTNTYYEFSFLEYAYTVCLTEYLIWDRPVSTTNKNEAFRPHFIGSYLI
jgi:hypothetical protein